MFALELLDEYTTRYFPRPSCLGEKMIVIGEHDFRVTGIRNIGV